MFFWTRSFLCIGTVVAMATGWSPGSPRSLTPDSRAENSAGQIGGAVMRLCQAVPRDCATALQKSLGHASIGELLQVEGLSTGRSVPPGVQRLSGKGGLRYPAL